MEHPMQQELGPGDMVAGAPVETRSVGRHLQDWLIRENVAVGDPLFVEAIDLALRNEMRQACAASP